MPTGPQREFSPEYNTGYGSAKVTPSGYVYNLSVREEHRGRGGSTGEKISPKGKERGRTYAREGPGAGSELVGKITADADTMGKTLTMHARPELHGFYGKHGFSHIGNDQFGPILQRQPQTVGDTGVSPSAGTGRQEAEAALPSWESIQD